jgi:hypothetical protein
MAFFFPCGTAEQGLKTVRACPVDNHNMFQISQTRLEGIDHVFEIETTESFRNNEYFGFAVLEHE